MLDLLGTGSFLFFSFVSGMASLVVHDLRKKNQMFGIRSGMTIRYAPEQLIAACVMFAFIAGLAN